MSRMLLHQLDRGDRSQEQLGDQKIRSQEQEVTKDIRSQEEGIGH